MKKSDGLDLDKLRELLLDMAQERSLETLLDKKCACLYAHGSKNTGLRQRRKAEPGRMTNLFTLARISIEFTDRVL